MLGVKNPLNFPSCVYVWVMNHLGVVFDDAFGLFWVFGWISKKRDEISQSGQFLGVLRRDIGIPRGNVSPRQGVACPCSGTAEREAGQASGTPRCSKTKSRRRPMPQRSNATLGCSIVHRPVFLSYFAIPLFR